MKHLVTNIQRFCMHDGPGLRTTVFLKGCPLRCFWCHNPETQSGMPELLYHAPKCVSCGSCLICPQKAHTLEQGHQINRSLCTACGQCVEACPTGALELAGRQMSSVEILEVVRKDSAFYGTDGGITVSGGEPMFHPDACLELLRLAKEDGLNTAVETSGFFPHAYVEPLCRVTDRLLWDIKDTNDVQHQRNTGVSNRLILENLRAADRYGVPIVLRCILLKDVNLNETHLRAVETLFHTLRNAVWVEFIPCHALGNSKGDSLGRKLVDLTPYVPEPAQVPLAMRPKPEI